MSKKKNKIVILIIVTTLLITSCGNNTKRVEKIIPGDENSLLSWIDDFIEETVKEEKLDGGISVMVYSDGDILYKNGSGWANQETEWQISGDTPMPVGSISKIFTSVAIMTLVEEGRINLDTPAGIYLPELKLEDGHEMSFTVRDLLTHHSGIPGDLFVDWFGSDKKDLYNLLKNRPLVADAEKLHSYANIGFSLLGLIIEEISGSTYAEYIRSEIFVPAGMANSLVYPGETDSMLPRGYQGDSSIAVPVLRDIPAGGLVISASDMGAFVQALYSTESPILETGTLQQMMTVQNKDNEYDRDFEIGLGFWLIDPLNTGVLNASHGGDLPPYHSVIITMPDSGLAVFAATNDHNKDGLLAINAAIKITEELLVWKGMERLELAEKGQFLPVSKEDHELFAGTYGTLAGLIDVEAKGDAFQMTLSGKKLYFAPRENGRYGAEFRILNKITIPVPQLEMMEFDMYEAGGDVWMALWMKGIYLGTFSKLNPVEYPGYYAEFIGEYESPGDKNIMEDGSRAIENINISEKSGRYILGITLLGQKVELALRPDGSYRALTDGTGRAMGDLLEFTDNNGEISLNWSGFILQQN